MKRTVTALMLFVLAGTFLSAIHIQTVKSSDPPSIEWMRPYGGDNNDHGKSVVETSDGGYAIAGETRSFGVGGADFWLVKTNAAGNHIWNHTYGGSVDDDCRSVIETDDGGFALIGNTNSFGARGSDTLLVKTYPNGTMEWIKTYGGAGQDVGYEVIQTSDGGYALISRTDSFGAGRKDVWLVKTDENGTIEWDQTYGGSQDDLGLSLIQTSDMGYALACHTNSYGAGSSDFWLVKTYPNGTLEWSQTYGGSHSDGAYSIINAANGGYVLAGGSHSFGVSGELNAWIVKTDSGGYMEWNMSYGGSSNDQFLSSVKTTDGGYAFVGQTQSFGAGSNDFWLVKTDSTGNMQWNQTQGGIYNDEAWSVVQTSDGGYAIAGITASFGAGGNDFWLIKTCGRIDETPNEVAEKAGKFVLSQAIPENGGYKWQYHHNHYGTIYIYDQPDRVALTGTFLTELHEETGNATYLDYGEGAAQWIISKAIPDSGGFKWARPNPLRPDWYLTPDSLLIGEFLLKCTKPQGTPHTSRMRRVQLNG